MFNRLRNIRKDVLHEPRRAGASSGDRSHSREQARPTQPGLGVSREEKVEERGQETQEDRPVTSGVGVRDDGRSKQPIVHSSRVMDEANDPAGPIGGDEGGDARGSKQPTIHTNPIAAGSSPGSPHRSLNHHSSSQPVDPTRILREQDAYHILGFSFPTWKKWAILTSVFIVQISMNFNAAIFGNAVDGMSEEFGVDISTTKVAQMLFLVMYAFGCEAWAPWSEEIGRKWVMQGSLFLVIIWAMACALSPSFNYIMAFRALGGLSSAGGSVTLGMVADMFEPEVQQHAVNYIVLSSVAGSVVAPIVGGFIKTYLHWRWVFWIQLIFGAFAQAIHFFVPETRSSVMLDKEAQRRRKSGEDPTIYGPNEARGTFWNRINFKEIMHLMARPYKFLVMEPICLFLSLLSGFSDALIFSGLDSFPLILERWNFSDIEVGLSFNAILIGYIISFLAFMLVYWRDAKSERHNPKNAKPERRLWLLLFVVVLEPIGLLMLGFGSYGPSKVHWALPVMATLLIGIANSAIYQATIDYMVAAYGPYSASATGGNGFCRDFLAGMAALYTRHFYSKFTDHLRLQLAIPTWILCGIALVLCIPVYVFYFGGEWFRKKSKYARQIANERAEINADLEPKSEVEMTDLSQG